MLQVSEIMELLSQHDSEMRARFGVAWIALFGSTVRGEARSDSDLDILVEFSNPTFRNYTGLYHFLEALLDRPVDLVSVAALRPRVRQEVLREARRVA